MRSPTTSAGAFLAAFLAAGEQNRFYLGRYRFSIALAARYGGAQAARVVVALARKGGGR